MSAARLATRFSFGLSDSKRNNSDDCTDYQNFKVHIGLADRTPFIVIGWAGESARILAAGAPAQEHHPDRVVPILKRNPSRSAAHQLIGQQRHHLVGMKLSITRA